MFSLVTGVAAYIVGSVRLLRCFSVFIVLECDCSTKTLLISLRAPILSRGQCHRSDVCLTTLTAGRPNQETGLATLWGSAFWKDDSYVIVMVLSNYWRNMLCGTMWFAFCDHLIGHCQVWPSQPAQQLAYSHKKCVKMCVGGDKDDLLKVWEAWNWLWSQFEAPGHTLRASWMHFGTFWPPDGTAKINLGSFLDAFWAPQAGIWDPQNQTLAILGGTRARQSDLRFILHRFWVKNGDQKISSWTEK